MNAKSSLVVADKPQVEVTRLRAIIESAVTELCLLAEEIQGHDQELADRIWDLANEHLELPVRA